MPERRLAVVDLGSNSFRLVVFTRRRRLVEADGRDLRVGADRRGARRAGLQPEPMHRALSTLELFAHFAARPGSTTVGAVATSAIRSASQPGGVPRAGPRALRPADPRAERRGGGPLRLSRRGQLDDADRRRRARPRRRLAAARPRRGPRGARARSWPLGAVRMTERFLPTGTGVKEAAQGAARARQRRAGEAGWLARARRRAARRHRRHGAQPRGGRADAAGCRRSACRASRSSARRSTTWSSASPLPGGAREACPASRPAAPT